MRPDSRPRQHPSPAARYPGVRAATERLIQGLSAEDCAIQSMPDASPVKWHLAHTTWFFEKFVLSRTARLPASPATASCSIPTTTRSAIGTGGRERGMLSRPSLEEVLAYRPHVDYAMRELLPARRAGAPART